jgi:hypothetical protein
VVGGRGGGIALRPTDSSVCGSGGGFFLVAAFAGGSPPVLSAGGREPDSSHSGCTSIVARPPSLARDVRDARSAGSFDAIERRPSSLSSQLGSTSIVVREVRGGLGGAVRRVLVTTTS